MSETEGKSEALIDAETVRALARVAELPLAEERVAGVAEQLNGLLGEANLVNRFMDARREVQPGVRYHHPEIEAPAP
jgi:Asp-tRNA(Asn)/Glu-tRNA(Gln) amidotransferase C subunit